VKPEHHGIYISVSAEIKSVGGNLRKNTKKQNNEIILG
jgi:hypothetical protein